MFSAIYADEARTHLSIRSSAPSRLAASDYFDPPLDFNELLIGVPAGIFAARIAGQSMNGAELFPDEIAIVDRSITPRSSKIVLALGDGEITLKRLPPPCGRRRDAGEKGVRWSFQSREVDRSVLDERTRALHPGLFTAALMRAAEARGAERRIGKVTGIDHDRAGQSVTGVKTNGEHLSADAVVTAMRPWSQLASQWLPLPPVYGLKGLFPRNSSRARTERPTRPLYRAKRLCSSIRLRFAPDPGALERLQAVCAGISPVLANSPVLARQACFLLPSRNP